MQKAKLRGTLEFRRCVICGMRLYTSSTSRCEWCDDSELHSLLHELLGHVKEILDTSEPSSPRSDSSMELIADIGGLASKHPYLTSLRKVLTMLLERGVAKRTSSAQKIWGTRMIMNAKRILPLLVKINLCGFRVDETGELEIEWPAGSIVKRAHSWLQTDPHKNDTAAFLLGYVLLHAIDETMELLSANDNLAFDQGVARLYPVDYDESGLPKALRLPKGITSVVSFILGSWARGWTEFDEFSFHKFLDARGVTGKEFNEALGLLSQTVPGISHGILKYETYSYGGVPIKRFTYSDSVLSLRNYLRERTKERIR